jgi:tRNA nucleotidyltransferase (CCA-adding enzyme)
LARLIPELSEQWASLPRSRLLEACSQAGLGLSERYASLVLTIDRPGTGARDRPGVQTTDDWEANATLDAHCSARLKVPVACRDFARLATRMWSSLRAWPALDAGSRLGALELCDAFRRPDRAMALAHWAQTAGTVLEPASRQTVADGFAADLSAARDVDAGAIARSVIAASSPTPLPANADRIASALRAARIEALQPGSGQG